MFGKGEKKKRSAKGALTVGALAAVGAISIFKKSKGMIKNAGKRVMDFFRGNKCKEEN